ncbi:MAG: alpha-E domain-containing protein [Chloroflexota bacterium]|nr:alpha-E domain-containing protein [Chloroflexota bacterium]
MLSRSAEGLYWLGRYLERAQHLSRLLRHQTEALVDRPVEEIHFGWLRIYGSLNRQPPVGSLELLAQDAYSLADSYTLADDLTFEPTNPDSVWSGVASGRENARHVRHCLSAEMWTCLNRTYLRIQGLTIQDIWASTPERFYAETVAEIDTFAGVTAATMYRDEGWRFLNLGRSIERVQLSSALLHAHITAAEGTQDVSEAAWTGLLRLYHALEAYNRTYSLAVEPRQVLDLLATDARLPDSLSRSLDMLSAELAAAAPSPNDEAAGAAQRLMGRMSALVNYAWLDRDDPRSLLRRLNAHGRELHDLVTETYFHYPVHDAPLR